MDFVSCKSSDSLPTRVTNPAASRSSLVRRQSLEWIMAAMSVHCFKNCMRVVRLTEKFFSIILLICCLLLYSFWFLRGKASLYASCIIKLDVVSVTGLSRVIELHVVLVYKITYRRAPCLAYRLL